MRPTSAVATARYRNIRLDKVPEKNYLAFTSTNRAPNDEAAYLGTLNPKDDQPPATLITSAIRSAKGTITVRGTTSDDGEVRHASVNGEPATTVRANFAEWGIVLMDVGKNPIELTAVATDAVGNTEQTPHRLSK